MKSAWGTEAFVSFGFIASLPFMVRVRLFDDSNHLVQPANQA